VYRRILLSNSHVKRSVEFPGTDKRTSSCVPRRRSMAGRYRIDEGGMGVAFTVAVRVWRYGFMNHGSDSR
jgi:hypothetical protein